MSTTGTTYAIQAEGLTKREVIAAIGGWLRMVETTETRTP